MRMDKNENKKYSLLSWWWSFNGDEFTSTMLGTNNKDIATKWWFIGDLPMVESVQKHHQKKKQKKSDL